MHEPRVCSRCVYQDRRMRRKHGHSWCKAGPRKFGTPFPEGRGCRLFQERCSAAARDELVNARDAQG